MAVLTPIKPLLVNNYPRRVVADTQSDAGKLQGSVEQWGQEICTGIQRLHSRVSALENAAPVSVSSAAAAEVGGSSVTDVINGGGDDGWTPTFALIPTATTVVMKLTGWVGGSGNPPASGLYVGPTGFTPNISQATNLLGPSGSGTGTYVINVKAYGATGNGITDDTNFINAAIAQMTNYSTLYFPAGKYLITVGGLSPLLNLNNITVCGDGRSSVLYSSTTGGPASYFLFVHFTCDHVTLRDFSIVGSATARGSGGHGLIVYSSFTDISGIYVTGTADFGMYISNGNLAYTSNVRVTRCTADRTLGDGFHFGAVTDSGLYSCNSYYTGDDGFGIGDDGGIGFPPLRIEVDDYQSIQAGNHAGGGTHGAGIRIFDGATDIEINGGSIYQSCEAGVTCGRFFTTTAYNTRVKITGLKVYQCLQQLGMYGQVNFQFCVDCSIKACWSQAPLSQGCYAFLDCTNLSVMGNTAKDPSLRAFVTDDGTTTNVAVLWNNWTITGNTVIGAPSNESFYIVPAVGIAVGNLMLCFNTDLNATNANYVATNRLAGVAKVIGNVSLTGKAIINGGAGIVPTATPNY